MHGIGDKGRWDARNGGVVSFLKPPSTLVGVFSGS